MLKKIAILPFLLLMATFLSAQVNINGKVISAETKQPLSGASVYLNNTSVGSPTNEHGTFKLVGVRAGKYQLVVSYVGYETYVMDLNHHHFDDELLIELKPKTERLADLVLEPFETNGWDKWGKLFTDNFIGTSSDATECELQNPTALKFRLSKKDSVLYAFAKEPLMIRNNALGYEIKYTMEEFEYDFVHKTIIYNGYPLFKDLALTNERPAKIKRWLQRREAVYRGSLMHFMRAFFTNQLTEEGFQIKSLALVPNQLKIRAKALFANNKDATVRKVLDTIVKKTATGFSKSVREIDSTETYKKSLQQPDMIVSNQVIASDAVGFAIDSTTAGFYSADSIEVSCLVKTVPTQYKLLYKAHQYEKVPISQLSFVGRKPVSVLSNGCYLGAHDLKITGFWAWWETVCTMLPYDYQVQ